MQTNGLLAAMDAAATGDAVARDRLFSGDIEITVGSSA
jgi:hypothetical protein